MSNDLYGTKAADYFGTARHELAPHVPATSRRVLEIGCGDGTTGALLKSRSPALEVVGVEMAERAAASARTRLDAVHIGDIEKLELPYPRGHFDVIIAADVLEHLVDPWSALRSLTDLLAPEGRVVTSIPNVRHWRVVVPLVLLGRWTYTESGLLDRTHLRFFTRRTMLEMLEGAGLTVATVEPLGRLSRWLRVPLPRPLRELLTPQFVLVGVREDQEAG